MKRLNYLSGLCLIGLCCQLLLPPILLARANEPLQAETQFKDAQYFVKEAGKDKAKPVKGTLSFEAEGKVVRFSSKDAQLEIPYDQISGMTYEKTSKPRYALGLLVAWPLLFTKSKGHYLTIQYKQPDKEGQFALIRLDKGNYQMALATAEAQTGKKIERIEER
ncbi:MAG: hypothetical protein IPM66_25020 [Acidobacteriota bacterium]|nr:MAG: hypothetical protein IPM66_25020 [Acidobacteriota bacterium]